MKYDLSSNNDAVTAKYSRYQQLYLQSIKTQAEIDEFNGLKTQLVDFLPDINDYNNAPLLSDITIQSNKIGNLSALSTVDKSSAVAALNETRNNLLNVRQIQRELAHMKMVDTLKNRVDGASSLFYDSFDNLNGGSIGKIDSTKTRIPLGLASGATTGVVESATGLSVGMEVTVFDDVNLYRPTITAISGTTITFSPATPNVFKAYANVVRSSAVVDLVNNCLKFGGWDTQVTNTITNQTVVSSAYDTSGNGGRKLVQTSNGNLFVVMRNAQTDFRIMKSTDNGVTTPWPTIVTVTGEAPQDVAMATDGTYIYVLDTHDNAGVRFRKYDQNGILQGSMKDVDNGQSALGNVSLAIAPDGSLHAAWASKNATFPNGFNIRYSKSTDGGVTWAAVTQLSNRNISGVDCFNPCVVLRGINPSVSYQLNQGITSNDIEVLNFNASAWSGIIVPYDAGGSIQANSHGLVKKYGTNIGRFWILWDGVDPTEGKRNVRASYSDDGGATWSVAVKITTGNTIDRQKGALSEDASGNIYITYMDNTGISYQQLPNGSTTWGAVQTLNATGTNPSVLERGLDFSKPLTIYMDASAVKFAGAWIVRGIIKVLSEDIRYNITPPAPSKQLITWVQRDNAMTVSGNLSIVAPSANESYSPMTKTTATIDVNQKEDQFVGNVSAANTNADIRFTMTRPTISDDLKIKYITGAISN